MKAFLTAIIILGFLSLPFCQEMSSKDTSKMDTAKTDTSKKWHVDPKDKGIGPVKNVKLGPINTKLASEGKSLFNSNCSSCHAMDHKVVGPPLGEVTEQRTPEFIMNMILNAPVMEQKDPKVQALVQEYHVNMPQTGLTEKQARAVLEYFRETAKKEEKGEKH
jgi:hypothetical protein